MIEKRRQNTPNQVALQKMRVVVFLHNSEYSEKLKGESVA